MRPSQAAATAAAYAELSASRLSPVRTVSPRRVSSPPPSVAISNVVEVVSPSRLYKMNIAPVQVRCWPLLIQRMHDRGLASMPERD